MNAFKEASEIEALAKRELLPWLNMRCESVEDTGDNLWLQKIVGDFIVQIEGRKRGVELKAEARHTGNLYLETWSNRPALTFGWLWTSRAHWLMYYFADNRILYVIDLPALQQWAVEGNIYRYAEKSQSKYDQLNFTWGRIVPVADIPKRFIKAINAEQRSK